MAGISFLGVFTLGIGAIVLSLFTRIGTFMVSNQYDSVPKTSTSQTQKASVVSFRVNEGTSAAPQYAPTGIKKKHIKSATTVFNLNDYMPQVELQLNGEGTALFAELTQQQQGKQIGIFADGKLIAAPVVQDQITDGRVVISGAFTTDQADSLAQQLSP